MLSISSYKDVHSEEGLRVTRSKHAAWLRTNSNGEYNFLLGRLKSWLRPSWNIRKLSPLYYWFSSLADIAVFSLRSKCLKCCFFWPYMTFSAFLIMNMIDLLSFRKLVRSGCSLMLWARLQLHLWGKKDSCQNSKLKKKGLPQFY